jgi:hypothetical protein
MRYATIALLFLTSGCVPNDVHQQQVAADQARISELLAYAGELQNQMASILATQRVLEIVCIVNALLLAVCLGVLWLRGRRKGATCT